MIRNVRLNDVVKKVGSTIIANPNEETTDVLKKVNIDGVIYEIQGGGSGEGLVSVSKEMTYAENDFGFDVITPFTEEEFTKLYGEKCDLYLFIRQDDGEGTFIMQGFSFNKFLTQDVNGELAVAYYVDMDATNRVILLISLSNGVIQHEFSIEGDTGARFIQLSATAEDWSDLTIENGAVESMYENLAAMVEVGSNEYYSTNIVINNNTAVIDFILTPTRHRIVTLTRPSRYEDFDTIANVAEEFTLVEANSGEETTETLTTLKIGTTNYALGSGGSEIVDINDLSVIPTDYQDIEKLKNVILFKNDLYYELTYADSDYLYYTNTYELAYNRISVSLIDYSINQAETINVDRVFGVEITDVPSTATNGTLTEEQLATLQASDSNYILFNNEKYYLNDKGHTEGYLTYSHLGAASEEIIAKTITITISTRAWVLLEEQVGGGGTEIIDADEWWFGEVPEEYRDAERLKKAWLLYNAGYDDYYKCVRTFNNKLYFTNGVVTISSSADRYTFTLNTVSISTSTWRMNSEPTVSSAYIIFLDTLSGSTWYRSKKVLQIGNSAEGYLIAPLEVNFNTLLSITAEATSGTITSDMLTLLQLRDDNYIVFNNQIYRLQDNENDSGVLTYTYVGHSAEIVSKTITITISTLAWTLSTVSITAEITGALEGDY